MDAPTTVSKPETTMARLLMAPSSSPHSIARAVPIAWDAAPIPSPFAIGSVMRNILQTRSPETFPKMPERIITATVIAE